MNYAQRVLDFSCRVAVLLALLQGVWVFIARYAQPNLSDVVLGSLLRSPFDELAAVPPQEQAGPLSEMQALRELRAKTPVDGHFLTFYQRGFAYYAQRPFISDLDPRMVEFYLAADTASALAVLRRLGIEYIYLPSWSWPTVDNSLITEIVHDPSLATLIVDRFGYRIYQLSPKRMQPQ